MRYLVTTASTAQRQADAIWNAYYTDQLAARGLPAGSSLDMFRGLPVEPPITVRYCEPITASGETQVAVPIDTYTETLAGRAVDVPAVGRVTIAIAAAVTADQLPQRLRDRVQPGDQFAAAERVR